MHIEEAGFQASKCVDFKMSNWEYRQNLSSKSPPAPPHSPLGILHIDKHMEKESAGFVGPRKHYWMNSVIYSFVGRKDLRWVWHVATGTLCLST